ncbi:cAMP-binding domain of CRP or a regulatory subunit of cAMP-dependent protein kinases [Pseudarcicella hirudinis]|uniref:cAMP-binding domain of CRP or a regulatory subunit of cAMP-dependent protein kinases n=1 Tax=Pseudarcicella hirudinis TaxID=1079859 RepID=A0A1I5M8A5_9BACT|nr:Crp/Fnr family transcriptional regulator [Pseudarcicella hirudinis]SFP05547.1 cAMP-binding domain of CRP or a regulatory subunit of cAMP-dependent protein kinases [Pseudarcicella hirudinis]
MAITQLFKYFQKFTPLHLDNEEQILLESKFIQRRVKRRQMILQEGFVCKHYFFVAEGCFRMYGIDDKGYEHNIQFAAESDWIADIGSFHSNKPSKLFIEAIEPSVILQIEQQDLYFLYNNIPKLNRIFKVIIENKYVELQNHVLQTFSSTAEQRYLSFLEQYSDLASRLPNTQIASYLGITPEFLSKIRKDLTKK